MRPSFVVIFAISAVTASSAWASDPSVDACDSLREDAHRVVVRDVDGVVQIDTERVFANPCSSAVLTDELLPVPVGAAVDRFEVEQLDAQGQLRVARSFVTDRERAIERHDRLGEGAESRRDPIAMEWYDESAVWVRNLEVAPGASVTLRYRSVVPCAWADGRCQVTLRERTISAGEVDETRAPIDVEGAADIAANAAPWPDETTRMALLEVAVERDGGPSVDAPVAARYGALQVADDTALGAVEIDLAAQLSPLPESPSYVFVVDVSRSMGAEGLRAQRRLIEDVLAHTPDAVAEVVLFDRTARRLTGGFVSPDTLSAELDLAERQGRLELRHGSMLDDAVALAAESLAGQTTPRLVVLSDGRLRYAWELEDTLARLDGVLPDDAIVHVVEPRLDDDFPALFRRDRGQLLDLAEQHGGISAQVDVSQTDPAANAPVVLGLVRPTRLDDVEIVAADPDGIWPLGEPGGHLTEGEGFATFDTTWDDDDDGRSALPEAIVVRGRLWSAPVEFRLTPDPTFSAAIGARAVVSGELDWDETESLALRLGIVSEHTSLVVVDPEHRALTWEMENHLSASGRSSTSRCGGSRCGVGSGFARTRNHHTVLAEAYEQCASAYGAEFATVHFESTGEEIVDVGVDASNPELATCLREAAWSSEVPAAEAGFAHSQWWESYPRGGVPAMPESDATETPTVL